MIKLGVIVLFTAHFCGCIFYFVGYRSIETYGLNNWINESELTEKSTFLEKYITSLYWAVITMLTVGYGEIRPFNKDEKLIVIFITIFSCGIYAYTLNRIG